MRIIKLGLAIAVLSGICLFVFFRNKEPRVTKPRPFNALRYTSPVAPGTAVVLVNSVPITAGDLEEEFNRLLPPTTGHGGADAKKKDNLRKMALEELIVRELAYQKAKAMQLRVEPAELNATVRKIQGRYQTKKSFQEALRAEEITEQEFVRRVEKDLLLRKISKIEVEGKAVVSDDEVKQYYEHNQARFLRPESIRLRQIVIKGTPGDGAAAKKKIDEVFRKLKAGESFEDLAYRYSEDDYRVMGGDYGWIHRGQLAPELENPVFAAKLKTLTGPLQTSFGWHLSRVEGRQSARQLKFEEEREKIAASLRKKRLDQKKAEFVRELKAGTKIQYLAPV